MDKKKKTALALAIFATFWFVVGGLCGFFMAKGIYNQPLQESVTRDTVTVRDTVTDYQPVPVDSARVRYVTRYLPKVVTDTVVKTDVITCHDSVLVEVPITLKHYGNETYDAWISGYEPSLDSIKVYQRTEYITEVRTISKPPNRWELDAVAGIDYNVATQRYTPHVGGELLYKPNRLQVGIRVGVEHTDKVEPVIGAVAKIRIM